MRDPQVLQAVLANIPAGFGRGVVGPAASSPADARPLFSAQDAAATVQATTEQSVKDELVKATKEAVDRGAFGAPWFWVRNDAGKEEFFFGSDRFHFIYEFLGLPYQDVALLESTDATAKNAKL